MESTFLYAGFHDAVELAALGAMALINELSSPHQSIMMNVLPGLLSLHGPQPGSRETREPGTRSSERQLSDFPVIGPRFEEPHPREPQVGKGSIDCFVRAGEDYVIQTG
jgi:hypothetical protein